MPWTRALFFRERVGEKTAEGSRVKILSGTAPPRDAYVAVRYRNNWFWVDDGDLGSRRIFTFLRMFSSIAETGVAPRSRF